MAFSTLVFLCFFLPLGLLLYYLPIWRGRHGRQLLLLTLSLFFYAWGEPLRVMWLIGSIVLNYLLLCLWRRLNPGKAASILFVLTITLNLAALGYGKYLAASLPLGLSFYTFKLLSTWFDLKRADTEPVPPLSFALYVSFFPQLISGPIGRYSYFTAQIPKAKASPASLVQGLARFLAGLFVKVLLADAVLAVRMSLLDAPAPGLAEAWLAALLYSLYIYLDFSSYSDMAIGLAEMFGFRTEENFNQPYSAISVADFWRRWHISLSSWFRDYVYIPLGGNRKGLSRQILNIFIVWSLTGIWHGSSLNFLLWGLYYALWLLLEKLFLAKLTGTWPSSLKRGGTFLIVTFGWVLFAFPDSSDLLTYLGTLFGNGGWGGSSALYQLSSRFVILIAAVFFSSSGPRRLAETWRKHRLADRPAALALLTATYAALLVLTFAYLLDQSFASFLYFNF